MNPTATGSFWQSIPSRHMRKHHSLKCFVSYQALQPNSAVPQLSLQALQPDVWPPTNIITKCASTTSKYMCNRCIITAITIEGEWIGSNGEKQDIKERYFKSWVQHQVFFFFITHKWQHSMMLRSKSLESVLVLALLCYNILCSKPLSFQECTNPWLNHVKCLY